VARVVGIIGLVFLSFATQAQQGERDAIDSLQSVLAKAKTDSTRFQVSIQLATAFYNVDLKKSLEYGQSALDLAHIDKNEAKLQQAYSILRRIHRRFGNFTMAIEYTMANLRFAEKQKDTVSIVETYSSLGNIYSSVENFPEANKNLNKAYYLGRIINSSSLSSIMNFMGRSFTKMGQYDSARYWINKALNHEQQSPQGGYTISYMYNNLAEIFYLEKKYDKALSYYDLSMRLPEENRSQFGMTFSLNGVARIYLEQQKYKNAVDAISKSLEISKRNSFRDKTKEAYGILYEIYEAQQDYENALFYYKQFNLYQDSIFSEDNIQFIENLKINYQTERVESENEILKKNAELKDARISEQRSIARGSVVAILSLGILLIILYLNFRQKKKTNALLSASNESLEQVVTERTGELINTNTELIRQNNQLEQFGYIIAHNLRSPVARILGLTNIVNSNHFEMPRDKVILDKLEQSALDLDTIIHDLNSILDVKKGVNHSFELVNLDERMAKVKSILKDKIQEANVILEERFEVRECYAIPAYIESVLYNLISNAIKYRSRDRAIIVQVSSFIKDEQLNLIVKDNGLGIDLLKLKDKVFSMYQRFHDHVEGKGIGLFLVKTQVEALNGTIDIESEVNVGTTFHVVFPMKK
jgi:signal transduction histidine kinase